MKKKLTKNQILTKQENIEKMLAVILDQQKTLEERKQKLLEDYKNLQILLEQKENPNRENTQVPQEREVSEESKEEAKILLQEFFKSAKITDNKETNSTVRK